MIQVKIEGTAKLIEQLSKLQRKISGEAALRDVSEEVRTATKEAIESSREPDTGKAWLPLKKPRSAPPKHGRYRKNGSADTKQLIDTGDLFREAGEHRTIRGNVLTIGMGMEYAGVHQDGTKDGRIPQRKFIPTEEQWYQKEFTQAMSRVIRKIT